MDVPCCRRLIVLGTPRLASQMLKCFNQKSAGAGRRPNLHQSTPEPCGSAQNGFGQSPGILIARGAVRFKVLMSFTGMVSRYHRAMFAAFG
jgi:hypothetical protein